MHSAPIQLPLWLLFTLVGLPQFSETVYSPSLPDIAHALKTSVSMVEYTLTIYLFAFALGMFFWGKVSDITGRKPSMLIGLLLYLVGCIGCYYSPSIEMLLFSRFIQAFGGSAGSVVGQAIGRDVFEGKALSRMYALMSSALGIPPAIGPVIGGFIAERFGWSYIFLFLIFVAAAVVWITVAILPETLPQGARRSYSLWDISKRLLADKKVMAYCWLVGCSNGIMFTYFSEGAFYLIELLGLSPVWYGLSFILIAAAMIAGGKLATKLHNRYDDQKVLTFGVFMMVVATGIFSAVVLCSPFIAVHKMVILALALGAHMASMAGRCLVNSSALSVALVNYRWCSGTASSVFGFMYYMLVSVITFGMGWLHNGTLYPMPLYFFTISVSMFVVNVLFLRASESAA